MKVFRFLFFYFERIDSEWTLVCLSWVEHEPCVTETFPLSWVLLIKPGMSTFWRDRFEGFTLLQVTLMVGSSFFPWHGMSRLRPASSLYCLSGVMLNDGGSCFISNKSASGRLQWFQQWILRLDYCSFGQDYLNNKRISHTINSLIVHWVWVDLY